MEKKLFVFQDDRLIDIYRKNDCEHVLFSMFLFHGEDICLEDLIKLLEYYPEFYDFKFNRKYQNYFAKFGLINKFKYIDEDLLNGNDVIIRQSEIEI